MMQAVEVFVQFENATIVKSQAFPDRVAALHDGIEWTHAGFIAMHEPTVDIDDQVAVLLVKFLEHLLFVVVIVLLLVIEKIINRGLRGLNGLFVGQPLRLPSFRLAGDAPALQFFLSFRAERGTSHRRKKTIQAT
jgi:hypothetical protein